MNEEIIEKINWLVLHVRYTQALCEVILEHLPETDKDKLITLAKNRVQQID